MTNTSWFNNVTDPASLVDGVVRSTNYGFAIALLMSVFFIVVLSLRAGRKDWDEIMIYTGVFEFLLCAFMIAIGWIQFYWLMFPIALLFVGIMVNRFAYD